MSIVFVDIWIYPSLLHIRCFNFLAILLEYWCCYLNAIGHPYLRFNRGMLVISFELKCSLHLSS
uniref:Uncharacterized protein n=1 Tax=Arundo donax TaxID=35708 RepID=A0A0A9G8F9_ARUDO